MEYIFTLKYQLSAHDCDQHAHVERLGEAGCDDALVGIGQPGRLALEFSREAASAGVALADVKRAVPSARLIEAAPDFVGLTDVADAVGVMRQNMRKPMLSHALTFPPPVHEGSAAVRHLADILAWLQARGAYELEQTLVEVAATTMQITLAKAVHQMVPRVQKEGAPWWPDHHAPVARNRKRRLGDVLPVRIRTCLPAPRLPIRST